MAFVTGNGTIKTHHYGGHGREQGAAALPLPSPMDPMRKVRPRVLHGYGSCDLQPMTLLNVEEFYKCPALPNFQRMNPTIVLQMFVSKHLFCPRTLLFERLWFEKLSVPEMSDASGRLASQIQPASIQGRAFIEPEKAFEVELPVVMKELFRARNPIDIYKQMLRMSGVVDVDKVLGRSKNTLIIAESSNFLYLVRRLEPFSERFYRYRVTPEQFILVIEKSKFIGGHKERSGCFVRLEWTKLFDKVDPSNAPEDMRASATDMYSENVVYFSEVMYDKRGGEYRLRATITRGHHILLSVNDKGVPCHLEAQCHGHSNVFHEALTGELNKSAIEAIPVVKNMACLREFFPVLKQKFDEMEAIINEFIWLRCRLSVKDPATVRPVYDLRLKTHGEYIETLRRERKQQVEELRAKEAADALEKVIKLPVGVSIGNRERAGDVTGGRRGSNPMRSDVNGTTVKRSAISEQAEMIASALAAIGMRVVPDEAYRPRTSGGGGEDDNICRSWGRRGGAGGGKGRPRPSSARL